MVLEAVSLNVCEDLDWKRALALHLCYGCGLTASLREAVDKYDVAFEVRRWLAQLLLRGM